MSENKYIAVTIGPIGDTMSLMDKPGALWLSSYMFSYACKRLCEKFIETGAATESIISPFIPLPDEKTEDDKSLRDTLTNRNDGVGLYHDHIILKYNNDVWNNFNTIKNQVIEELARIIYANQSDEKTSENPDDKIAELKKYIMINGCVFTAKKDESVILKCGRMLDSLELPKVFNPVENNHPIKSALSNESVKSVASDGFGIKKFDLLKTGENTLKELSDIANPKNDEKYKKYKKSKYFCVLRADGDNMSKILEGLKDDKKCRDFSKTCLLYCSKVAKRVRNYGGIPIYAGGDDLLAIIPCEGERFEEKGHGTCFDLIGDIDGIFKEVFKNHIESIEKQNQQPNDEEKKPIPSLSFGVLICYHKFPLYEAMNRSASLLFGVAKNSVKEKNCIAFQLIKHSGQSEELLIKKDALRDFAELLENIIKSEKDKNDTNKDSTKDTTKDNGDKNDTDEENILLSASQKLIMFNKLFAEIADKEAGVEPEAKEAYIRNLFKNTFDSAGQLGSFLKETLPDFYIKYFLSKKIILLENDNFLEGSAKALGQTLRVMKFFIEKQ